MSNTLTNAQSTAPVIERYRLVLFNDSGRRILLPYDRSSLPSLDIPRFTRPAQQLNAVLNRQWGLRTVLLWREQIASAPGEHYAVLEVSEHSPVFGRLDWTDIESIEARLSSADSTFVRAAHIRSTRPGANIDSAPFSRLGWIGKMRSWVNTIVADSGSSVEDWFQLGGSASTTLVRFHGAERTLWLKAVGQANRQEFNNTRVLSQLLAEYLPRILAFDPLLNAWLMESGGTPLQDHQHPGSWMTASRRLAALQVQSVPLAPRLLESGFDDLRLEPLRESVPGFFDVMAELMGKQTKSSPPPLTAQELGVIASTVEDAIGELSHLGIPYALGHHDCNPGNILIDGDSCRFIDWSAGHVSCPLLTLEYFIAHCRRSCATAADHCEALRAAYAACWLTVTSADSIARALQLSPLVAVYASAIAGKSWKDPERLDLPGVAGYLRSLTRIMKQEVQTLQHQEESCLN